MPRRRGVMLVVIVPLAFAAVSSATTVVPLFSTAYGPITSLTPSELTVQAKFPIPTSCTRTSSSPAVARFKVGDRVTIACKQGVLASITMGRGQPGVGRPSIPIPGLADTSFSGLPVPGPRPTQEQCAAAWNKNAPLASRQAIGALTPLAVQVFPFVTTGSPSPSSHVISTGPTCTISFFLPGARTASVSSVWKHGTSQDWTGFVDGGYAVGLFFNGRGVVFVTQPGFSVSANGTLSSAA